MVIISRVMALAGSKLLILTNFSIEPILGVKKINPEIWHNTKFRGL